MTRYYSIGLDVGTSVIKAAAFSEAGKLIKIVSEPAPKSKIVDRASQDMNEIWDITRHLLTQLVEKLDDSTPISIGVCGQGDGLWMLDQDGTPVTDAMLWNDSFAQRSVDEWGATGAAFKVSRNCGTDLWAGTSAAIYKQLELDAPDLAAKAATILNSKDWINYKLTGKLATIFQMQRYRFLI